MTHGSGQAARTGRPARAVFFGSGAFGVPILEALARTDVSGTVTLVGVVSVPDRPVGRGNRPTAVPVAATAGRLGLDVMKPSRLRNPGALATVAELGADVAILADYGRLVPPEMLAIPPRGFLNLHPSLLPRHRGATPIPAVIRAGDPETGVTLFEMDEGLDTGPIVAQVEWPLGGDETAPSLEAASATAAAELLLRELGPWLAGRRPARSQDPAAATLTRPLRREDGRLDPRDPAVELERQVRAYVPWPGTFLEAPGIRLAVLEAGVTPTVPGDEPGHLVVDGEGLALATVDGRLRLEVVRPAGRTPMTGVAFRNGHPGVIGASVLPEAGP